MQNYEKMSIKAIKVRRNEEKNDFFAKKFAYFKKKC